MEPDRMPMSDELRQACEALVRQLNELPPELWDTYDERDCVRLMAFARAQQAKGLREAAKQFDVMFAVTDDRLDGIRDIRADRFYGWLKDHATAWEAGQ